ncbi:hypothetical protein [Brevibacterium sp. LS14]|uniref:hypothetical protein n=1 Tax=Brevibacterium sp. LS14 TaxID=2528962 RepID=UPI00142F67B8
MALPDYPPEWWDVSFGIRSGYVDGYRDGHRDGHYAGWEAGIRAASAQDAEFARMVEQEFHRRELQGEREADLVRRIIDALRTEQNRQNFYPRGRAA